MRALLESLPFWPKSRVPRQPALELIGQRVALRPLCRDDAEAMYAFASDPDVTRFLPWQPATNLAVVRAFIDQQEDKRRRGESLGLAIILRSAGIMIGSTDLMQLRSTDRLAELGYILSREYWGQGLMTEAAALSRDYAFQTLGRQLLIAFADQENIGSRRVLLKTGMTEVGTEWRLVKERERLYFRYELTRAAWEQRTAPQKETNS